MRFRMRLLRKTRGAAQPVPAAALAFLPVFAAVTGGVERVLREFPDMDGADPVEGCKELPPFRGWTAWKRETPSGIYSTCPPVTSLPLISSRQSAIAATRSRSAAYVPNGRAPAARTMEKEPSAVIRSIIAGDPLLLRDDADIGLDCRLPGVLVARSYAELEKWLH